MEAKENGFSDVLFLDSVHQRYVEETSTANIFLVKVWLKLWLWLSTNKWYVIVGYISSIEP